MNNQPAMPLDNKEAIAAINRSIDFLISEFIRPTALQTAANADAIAKTNAGIRELKESLEIISKVADDAADESSANERKILANQKLFENLLNEARADRAEWRAGFEKQKTRDEADRAEWRAGFEAERTRSDERFNAQQEVIQRLLLEIRSTNGEVKQLGDRVNELGQAS